MREEGDFKSYLSRRDTILGKFISIADTVTVEPNTQTTLFEALVTAVIGQQLSGKAASSILSKLKLNLEVVGFITAEDLLKVPFETIRSSGVSGSKANTLLSIAQGSISHTIPSMSEITSMENEEITSALTKIKGIGTWTAEMILIFQLGREDVMPSKDLGVQKGYSIIFGTKNLPTPKDILKRSERWRPYRTMVAKYCWMAADKYPAYKKGRNET